MALRTANQSEPLSLSAIAAILLEEARNDANRWLVRFTPLTDALERLDADDCRQRLKQLPALREDGARVLAALERDATPADAELLATLTDALAQLAPLERDIRLRLSAVAPADPEGAPDLSAVRSRIARVAARHEIAEISDEETSQLDRLELPVSRPNWIGALFPSVFAFGWLSFTTSHAAFMISAAVQKWGVMGLGLLAFYSIFFLVGLAMAWAAVCAASSESLTLERDGAVFTRRLLGWSWSRRCLLGPDSRALKTRAFPNSDNYAQVVALSGADRELRLGSNLSSTEQDRLIRRINAYLGVGEGAPRG